MSKRGTIMRDPSRGPGLVMVQGQQFQFALEGAWRSETLPRPGVVVDVTFDSIGQVATMAPVPETRLAREQADAALAFAREKGSAFASGLVARLGVPRLVAAALLVLGWFFLSTVSVDGGLLGQLKITFWQMLGFLNVSGPMQMLASPRGGPGAGLYGLVALLCLVGPFLAYFKSGARAHLAGLLPLLFMMGVTLVVWVRLSSAMDQASDLAGGEYASMYADMQRQARSDAMDAISVGSGAYLSLLAAVYFAAAGLRGFFVGLAAERVALGVQS